MLFLQRKLSKIKSSSSFGAAGAVIHDFNTSLYVKDTVCPRVIMLFPGRAESSLLHTHVAFNIR